MDIFRNMASIAIGKGPLVQPLVNSLSHFEKDNSFTQHNDEVLIPESSINFSQKGNHKENLTVLKQAHTEKSKIADETVDILKSQSPEHLDNTMPEEPGSGNKNTLTIKPEQNFKKDNEIENDPVLGLEIVGPVNDGHPGFYENNPVDEKLINEYEPDKTLNGIKNSKPEDDIHNGKNTVNFKIDETEAGKISNSEIPEDHEQTPKEINNIFNINKVEQVLGLDKVKLSNNENIEEKTDKDRKKQTEKIIQYNRAEQFNLHYPQSFEKPGSKPTIRISIGRIEVKAVTPYQKTVQKAEQKKPQLSLNDYLQSLNGEKR